MTKKIYSIPVTYTVHGEVRVKAESLEEAIVEAKDRASSESMTNFWEGIYEVDEALAKELN